MSQSLFGDSPLSYQSGQTLYGIWAPPNSQWSPWVAPALFAQMECREGVDSSREQSPAANWFEPRVNRAQAIVVDLPGAACIMLGVTLARIGYRPVPLINASPGPIGPMPALASNQPGVFPAVRASTPGIEVVDMRELGAEVCAGGRVIQELNLPDDAPPAFILDANRLQGSGDRRPERFDNRWMVFPQDFPSAKFLAGRGITRAVVVQDSDSDPREDLRHVLLRWQEAGIEIQLKNIADQNAPRAITVTRPSRFREIWYRALAMLGLFKSSVGGFGSFLPTSSGGFG